MKKLLPVFLTLIMVICSFSACENNTNPLDKFDNITAYSTIDELKAIFDGCEIKDETETSFTVIDDNSVLQPLAEKYKDDIPVEHRPIEFSITSGPDTFMKDVHNKDVNSVFIYCSHDFHKLNEQDKDELLKQFTDKYGEFELEELKKDIDGNQYYYVYSDFENVRIRLTIRINTGVSISYFFY